MCEVEDVELFWAWIGKITTVSFEGRSSELLPPQGFRPEGEIPRRHSSNSRINLREVFTVEIYSQYAKKNIDLLEQGSRGIGR